MARRKVEYKVEHGSPLSDLQEDLNIEAAKGWTLDQMVVIGDRIVVVYIRSIVDGIPEDK